MASKSARKRRAKKEREGDIAEIDADGLVLGGESDEPESATLQQKKGVFSRMADEDDKGWVVQGGKKGKDSKKNQTASKSKSSSSSARPAGRAVNGSREGQGGSSRRAEEDDYDDEDDWQDDTNESNDTDDALGLQEDPEAAAQRAAEREKAKQARKEREAEKKKAREKVKREKERERAAVKSRRWRQAAFDELSEIKPTTLTQKIFNCGVGFFVLICVCGMFALRFGEENYDIKGMTRSDDVDYYAALEVARSADQSEIKRSYRKLSLRWHPDKNPNCQACLERFREISKAYEILGDEEKRRLYDEVAGEYDAIPSSTTTLTAETYSRLVLESNDVWIIQLYSDFEGLCREFSPVWEETAFQLGRYLKFGRLNVNREKKAMKLLPLKPGVLPTTFIYARGTRPEIYSRVMRPTVESLKMFLIENFPNPVQMLRDHKSLLRFLSADTTAQGVAKLLLITSRPQPSLLMKAASHKWQSIFMFGQASPHALGSFMKDWHIARDQPTLLVFPEFVAPGEPPSPIGRLAMAKRSNEEKLFTALLSMHQYVTPYVHRHNADLLCRSNPLHRVYCLVLINVLHESEYKEGPGNDTMTVETLHQHLDESKRVYHEDNAHLLEKPRGERGEEEASGDGDGDHIEGDSEDEELVEIQTVRLSTIPTGPFSLSDVPPTWKMERFMHFWRDNLSEASTFLLDLDGQRFAKLSNKTQVYENLYQNLQDELLMFERLPDRCEAQHFTTHCLYNPRESFLEDLYRSIRMAKWWQLLLIPLGIAAVYLVISYLGAYGVFMFLFFAPFLISALSTPFWSQIKTLLGL
ncbi:unnamed protein product [Vitrella brassicaformis CCMP3155]|uniref:DnaJ homolog subfamily C member 16 n=1 Tax=Vitrella brassicaformis (strain CCMP3155) TaxID=1169540 RepID=A0A0G4EHT3_VITBC|nr:unnamed protein product [Vitrella brassicaformis CCMP3155]|mmetsp:Transcript_48904/g.122486  ORF Transcript_48904/g.122486 Transcript_48904/m.122486 type:complete len:811 (-) Transcript_48904:843-3275(-)|eukprot:CEL95543.1 unnamed protein product [Vitrella brassicaformis CCMP3155]